MTTIKVGAFQGPAIYGGIQKSIKRIIKTLKLAQKNNIDILCFPECYLQGYLLDEDMAMKNSLDLDSQEFKNILAKIHSPTTIILGLIERGGTNIYNTAVIIENGLLVGKYRKQKLLQKEKIFTAGSESPVFSKKNVLYGINICSDTRSADAVSHMAKQGAKILFFPLNNSLPHETANKWKDKHMDYWKERAKETTCWVITADVIEESQTHTGFGFSTILNSKGEVIKSAKHFNEELIESSINIS